MKIVFLFLISIFLIGCGKNNVDNLLLAKYNIVCKEHYGARNINYMDKDKYIICNDGYVFKNVILDNVYGEDVYKEFIRLEKEDKGVK